MLYSGYYINLDRNADRLVRIEEELARVGLGGRYERFAACNGNALGFPEGPTIRQGEIGCFSSHYKLLDEHRDATKPLHIIEDDIVLSSQMERVLDWVISSGCLDKADLIFTDVAVPLFNNLCHTYKNFYDRCLRLDANGNKENVSFNIVDLKTITFGSTCSFLVNPQSIGKIADLYHAELSNGARLPVDLFIRKLCFDGVLRTHCIFPFVTSIRPESCMSSSIEKRHETLSGLAGNMLRYSFFIDCDLKRLHEDAVKIFPQPAENDLHRQAIMRLLGYSLLPDYKST